MVEEKERPREKKATGKEDGTMPDWFGAGQRDGSQSSKCCGQIDRDTAVSESALGLHVLLSGRTLQRRLTAQGSVRLRSSAIYKVRIIKKQHIMYVFRVRVFFRPCTSPVRRTCLGLGQAVSESQDALTSVREAARRLEASPSSSS